MQCDFHHILLKRDASLVHTYIYVLIVVFKTIAHIAICFQCRKFLANSDRYDLDLANPLGTCIDLDPVSYVASNFMGLVVISMVLHGV